MPERSPGEKPHVWTDVMEITDDLAQFARRVEDKLDDRERLTLENLVLRLDTFVDQLPRAIHQQIMHWRETRNQEAPHA